MNMLNSAGTKIRHPLENRIPPPLMVLLVGTAMGAMAWFTPSLAIDSLVRFIAGGIVIAIGASFVVTGARTFWRARTTIDPVNISRASTLVTTGFYRYTRNPMYVGFTVMLIGLAIFLAAPWTLFGPIFFVLFTNRYQIIPEERAMELKFGKEYAAYRANVPRWI